MALPLVVDGVTFNYPQPGDRGYAQDATDWANAITDAVATLQTDFAADLQQSRVRAHISAAQSSISSATVVVFDVEDLDDAGGYNPSTGVFTVPANYAGDYMISASVTCTQVSSTGNQTLTIEVNGSVVAQAINDQVAVGTATSGIACCVPYTLSVSDTVRVRLAASAGSITTVAGAGSQFSLLKVPHA